MADKKFSIEFDVNANTKQIISELDKLKTSFQNFKPSDSIKKNMDSLTSSLEAEIKNFKSIVGEKFTDNKQVAAAEASFKKISNLIRKIEVETRSVHGIDPHKLLPDEIKKNFNDIIQQINKLQNLKGNFALAEEFNEANEKIKEAEKNAKSLQLQMAQVAKKLYTEEKQKTGKDTLTKQEQENLRANNDEYRKAKEIYEEARQKVDELKKAKQELIDKNKDEGKDVEELGEAYKELGSDIGESTEKIKEKIVELAQKMNQELTIEDLDNLNLDQLQAKLNSFTIDPVTKGLNDSAQASKNLATALEEPERKLRDVSEEGKEIGNRAREVEQLANQVKQFFSIGNTVQLFKRAIRSAFDTIKELDAVMTQTAVVTDFSVGDMWAQLPEYTKRANELGVSVKGAYEAATLYYQQGLDTNQVMGVSNETLKMAKIAAIDYATATDYMTSALRGFNMEVNEDSARKINDIYSQLAAKTAADTEEISIAMSKTAPLAHNAGMEIETTAALLSQMIETTREAPETLGTAMKTVIARFQELKKDPALIEPVEGEIVDANKIEAALRTIGVALRDTSGQFRDLDDVFLEISQKWNSLDTNTQRYIATIAAGSRQQSRFIAMMANYDRTMELVEYANNSAGASQKQFEKTLDSMQSKLDRLKNAWNEFTMGLANNSVIKTIIDLLTDLLNIINKISSGISGNNGILKSLVDIGILMGGLKLGKAAFSGFFGWLQGTGGKAGKKVGDNLSKGLLGSLTNFGKSGFLKKIKSISDTLDGLDFGVLTKKEAFNQIFPIITKLGVSFKNLKTTATETGNSIINIFKKIPPQAYAIAGGIAAAVTVLALFIKGIKDSSIEGRIKAAEESTKQAETAANQAKEAYDNLLEGKSKYSELQNTLDNLTYGTTAWKEALIEANNQVLQLVSTFPQLAGYLTTGAGGRLQIEATGWDEIIKQQEEAIRRTSNDLIGSQIYKSNLENEKLFKDLQRELGLNNRPEFLNELIDLYKTNPIAFTKDGEGNYRQELLDFLNIEGVNADYIRKADPDKIIAAADAIGQYVIAVGESENSINSYIKNLVATNSDLDKLGPEAAQAIQDAFSKGIAENYNQKIDKETENLQQYWNIREVVESYGLEAENSITKNLKKLYTHLAQINGEEIDETILSNNKAMAEAIARMRFGDEIQSNINDIIDLVQRDTSGGVQKILDVFGGELSKFNSAQLTEYEEAFGKGSNINKAAKILGMTTDNLEEVIIDMGYTVIDAEGNIEADFESFSEAFTESCLNLGAGIQQAKINLVENMLKAGYSEDIAVLNLQGLTDEQQIAFSGFSNKITGLESNVQQQLFEQISSLLKKSDLSDTTIDLLNNIDFSKPTESILALEEAANSGDQQLQNLASTMLNLDEFSASSAFKDFMMSDAYGDIEESLQDFIKEQGKISSKNILDLAASNSKLNNLLKIGTVNATGLAKTLTAVANGNIGFEQISTATLVALSSVTDLEEELITLNDKLNNFDAGESSTAPLEKYSSYLENLSELFEKGNFGDAQTIKLVDFLFGENAWLEFAQEGEAGIAALQEKVSGWQNWLANGSSGFWTQAATDNIIEGVTLAFDEAGYIAVEQTELTTSEFIDNVSKAYEIPRELASAFVQALAATSPDLRLNLETNEAKKEYQTFLDEISKGQPEVISTKEIDNFAAVLGKDTNEIIDELKQLNGSIKIVDWFDGDGIELYGNDLKARLESTFSTWGQDFDLFNFFGIEKGKDGTLTLDYEIAVQNAEDLKLSEQQLESLKATAEELSGKEITINSKLEPEITASTFSEFGEKLKQKNTEGTNDLLSKANSAVSKINAAPLQRKMNTATYQGIKNGGSTAISELRSEIQSQKFNIHITTTNTITDVWSNNGGGGNTRTKRAASGVPDPGLAKTETVLAGEEGYELAYDNNGAFILGANGPEVTKLEKGTIIYPHEESKKILKGYHKTSFPNFASGTENKTYMKATPSISSSVTTYSEAASNLASTASSAEKIAETSEEITKETEKWENSISFIYNLTEKINHETRTRDKLERQYNRLLKTHTATGEELKRITDEEVVSLKKKQQMQKESIELLKKELHAYMMLNKEMMKYAIIDNWDDMTIHVAWNTINSVTDPEEGRRIEEFIDRLESTRDEIQDLEDSIEDIEDELIEIKERGKEQYRNLEDRVLDALISEQQEMIDEQEKTIKAIGDAESSLVDAIQKNIDKMRQDRENEETEFSIAEKERRLAYLRQDTTGSNALEIKKLEDELAKEKQDYSDSLIDQALKDLKDQNDVAKEQRDKQIEIAQSQLDWQEKTGYWADEATRIVREGIGERGIMDENSRLYKLLYDQENVASMSNASQDWWKEQLQDTISEAFVYLKGVIEGQQPEVKQYKDDYMAEMINQMNSGDYAGFAANERERNEKISAYGMEGQWPSTDMSPQYEKGKKDAIDMSRDYQADINKDINAGNWSSAFRNAGRRDAKIAKMNGTNPDSVYETYQQVFQKWYAATGSTKYYKRGGLADFTGPAWLDGSKTKPEMVLNAKDTQNFIQLKDILAGLRSGIVGQNKQNGDWYFDIDINVGEIANDYDVDKVAERIKRSIYEETAYRNVNAINFLK